MRRKQLLVKGYAGFDCIVKALLQIIDGIFNASLLKPRLII